MRLNSADSDKWGDFRYSTSQERGALGKDVEPIAFFFYNNDIVDNINPEIRLFADDT